MTRPTENSKLRWSKFWWKDWQGDQALRSCSVAARGFWMDLLCIAHEGEPHGHVTIGGTSPTTKRLAIIAGVTEKEARALLEELREARVFSVTDEGVIFSRRMVRDKVASDAGRENGKAGGNPALKIDDDTKVNGGGYDGGLTPPLGKGVKLEAEAEKEAESEKERGSLRSPRARDPDPDFEAFWRAYPRKVGKGAAAKAWLKAKTLAAPDAIIAAIAHQPFDRRQRFIPHPATWLNQERWLDEQTTFDPVLRAAGLSEADYTDETPDWLKLPGGSA